MRIQAPHLADRQTDPAFLGFCLSRATPSNLPHSRLLKAQSSFRIVPVPVPVVIDALTGPRATR